jgi:hypothetical protein
MRFALESDVHDERLWMPIERATGALGNTSCLVGTPEQVAEAILKYYRLGVDSFLIRGFDPLNDAIEFGPELIPRSRPGPSTSIPLKPLNDWRVRAREASNAPQERRNAPGQLAIGTSCG